MQHLSVVVDQRGNPVADKVFNADFYKFLFLFPFELLFLLATTNYVQNQLFATLLKLQIATCWLFKKKCT